MADASIDIRIFLNKELLSADMAELMDASIFSTGVIQGCQVHEVNGILNVDSGRLVVGGRLGVVTGGTIPIPELSQQETCYLLAICDLSNPVKPFYFSLLTTEEITRLGIPTDRSTNTDFNVTNGIGAATLGYCTVNPATGLVSGWTAMPQATARKGLDWYNEFIGKIGEVSDRITNLEQIRVLYVNRNVTLPTRIAEDNASTATIDFNGDLPAGTKLAGVDITIGGLHLPYIANNGFLGTWVSNLGKRNIKVKNRSGAWNNYEMAAVLFYVTDPNPNS